MSTFKVTRAHLKTALDQGQWDLLDKLLELDNALINDNALYTDTWGEWWGLLLEAVKNNQLTAVKVLLKHGAQRDLASWGDCLPCTPIEAAHDKPEILALLQNPAHLHPPNRPVPAPRRNSRGTSHQPPGRYPRCHRPRLPNRRT